IIKTEGESEDTAGEQTPTIGRKADGVMRGLLAAQSTNFAKRRSVPDADVTEITAGGKKASIVREIYFQGPGQGGAYLAPLTGSDFGDRKSVRRALFGHENPVPAVIDLNAGHRSRYGPLSKFAALCHVPLTNLTSVVVNQQLCAIGGPGPKIGAF